MYCNNTFKFSFVFNDFPIGLKENLREEDNLSTRDNWPVPKVSFVRRFYCNSLRRKRGAAARRRLNRVTEPLNTALI